MVVSQPGSLLQGFLAFEYWRRERKLPVAKNLQELMLTKKKCEPYYDQHANINGMEKLKNTKGYEKILLDDIYYLDFYAIEHFGKTRLGTLLHYAKQGQNKYLMSIMQKEIAPRIQQFEISIMPMQSAVNDQAIMDEIFLLFLTSQELPSSAYFLFQVFWRSEVAIQ